MLNQPGAAVVVGFVVVGFVVVVVVVVVANGVRAVVTVHHIGQLLQRLHSAVSFITHQIACYTDLEWSSSESSLEAGWARLSESQALQRDRDRTNTKVHVRESERDLVFRATKQCVLFVCK